jgi:drug/metabolite transporter (DMT)-like permease
MSTGPVSAGDNPLKGIALFCTAALMFTAMDTTAKYLAQTYPVWQVVWARYAFNLLFALVLIAPTGLPSGWLCTRRPVLQILRGLLLIASTAIFFNAIHRLPLAEAASIGFTSPLIVTALSVPLLGEKVGIRRWSAVLVGFLGVLVIVRPGVAELRWELFLPLGSAFVFALYAIITRVLTRTDSAQSTLLWSAIVGTAIASVSLFDEWRAPDAWSWTLMVGLGVLGGLSHYIIIHAYSFAPASTLAPFTYIQLISMTTAGYLVFGDFPDGWTIGGAAVIAGSGIYVFYREAVLRHASRVRV